MAVPFPSTQWSVVVAAQGGDDPAAREALATLCARYREPLVAFARRRGCSQERAEDVVQGLFVQLLERRTFARARPDRGRFRSFLLGCFTRYLADDSDRAAAAKRGGDRGQPISANTGQDGSAAQAELADTATPESEYARRWALATLAHALAEVEAAYARSGRGAVFETLRATLTGEAEPYAELARRLGSSEGAVKTASHRLRQRFAQALRSIVASTVATPDEVEDELRFLLRALG
jgi:RNA polymerase sigma factor (sigma-70 family)